MLRTSDGVIKASLGTALPQVKSTLVANWFSDHVRCPEGRLITYSHHTFACTYERDRIFAFDHGRLVQQWLVMNPPEPIIYRINNDGQQTCVADMCIWDSDELPDPLGESGLNEIYRVWGRPPVFIDDADADEEYVIGGALIHHPC